MQQQGQISLPVKHLRDARKQQHSARYEPFKSLNALQNAMVQGVGKSIETMVPVPKPPGQQSIEDLTKNGALVLLGDQEPKQSLGSVCFGEREGERERERERERAREPSKHKQTQTMS